MNFVHRPRLLCGSLSTCDHRMGGSPRYSLSPAQHQMLHRPAWSPNLQQVERCESSHCNRSDEQRQRVLCPGRTRRESAQYQLKSACASWGGSSGTGDLVPPDDVLKLRNQVYDERPFGPMLRDKLARAIEPAKAQIVLARKTVF